MDIQKDPTYQSWITRTYRKPQTQQMLKDRLQKYCQHTQLTPTELITEARKDQEDISDCYQRRIQHHLNTYLQKLQTENLSHNTIHGYIGSLKNFYNTHKIEWPSIPKPPTTRDNPAYHKLPDRELIKRLLELASPRMQALILLHCTSGMGSAEARSLNIQDLHDALTQYQYKNLTDLLQEEFVTPTWHIKRVKTGRYYYTFTTPEATHTLIKYLQLHDHTDPDTPIFVNRDGRRLSESSHNQDFRRLNDKARLGRRPNGYSFLTSHVLRKWFITTLYEAEIDYHRIEWLAGHTLPSVQAAYYKTSPQKMLEVYKKVIPQLTITQPVEVKILTDQRVEQLESRIRELEMLNQMRQKQDILPPPPPWKSR